MKGEISNLKSIESIVINKFEYLNLNNGEIEVSWILIMFFIIKDSVVRSEYIENIVLVSLNCCIIIDGEMVMKLNIML